LSDYISSRGETSPPRPNPPSPSNPPCPLGTPCSTVPPTRCRSRHPAQLFNGVSAAFPSCSPIAPVIPEPLSANVCGQRTTCRHHFRASTREAVPSVPAGPSDAYLAAQRADRERHQNPRSDFGARCPAVAHARFGAPSQQCLWGQCLFFPTGRHRL